MERGPMTSKNAPAFLFDLDGTLVDSVYQHVLAWREALESCGIELAVWRIHRRIGMSGGLLVNALLRETGRQGSNKQGEAPAVACRRLRPASGPGSASAGRQRVAGVVNSGKSSLGNCHE